MWDLFVTMYTLFIYLLLIYARLGNFQKNKYSDFIDHIREIGAG